MITTRDDGIRGTAGRGVRLSRRHHAKLPEWATEFARELKMVDGRYKVVNRLGELYFEIHADERPV